MPPVLIGRELRKSYGLTPALRGASIAVDEGEIVAVMGPSCCHSGTGSRHPGRAACGCWTASGRVVYVRCPYPPETWIEPSPGGRPADAATIYITTDGSLAAENRVRTKAANLVPNAIIHSGRDPVNSMGSFFRDMDPIAAVVALFVLIVGAFGLATSMLGGLIERRRSFALLRASGVYLGELRRVVLLETAVTMAVVSVVGAGIGMLLGYGATLQGDVAWRWPGAQIYAVIGGGVLAAVLFSTIALPLLSLTTRQDAVRFE